MGVVDINVADFEASELGLKAKVDTRLEMFELNTGSNKENDAKHVTRIVAKVA